jgi:hypothetical protein
MKRWRRGELKGSGFLVRRVSGGDYTRFTHSRCSGWVDTCRPGERLGDIDGEDVDGIGAEVGMLAREGFVAVPASFEDVAAPTFGIGAVEPDLVELASLDAGSPDRGEAILFLFLATQNGVVVFPLEVEM